MEVLSVADTMGDDQMSASQLRQRYGASCPRVLQAPSSPLTCRFGLMVDVRVGHVMLLAGPALHRLGSLACSVCVGGRRCVELPRLADFECVARTWRICKRRRPLGITTACPLWCAGSCPLGLGARPSFASFWRFREDACVTAHVWSL